MNKVGASYRMGAHREMLTCAEQNGEYSAWQPDLGQPNRVYTVSARLAAALAYDQTGPEALIETLAYCGVTYSEENVTDDQWKQWELLCSWRFFADYLLKHSSERATHEFENADIETIKIFLEPFK